MTYQMPIMATMAPPAMANTLRFMDPPYFPTLAARPE